MSVDPNVYALSIQLSLESSAAFASLEEFGNAATTVEENISTAAQNSLNAISGIVGTLSSDLAKTTTVVKSFADEASRAESSFTNINAAIAASAAGTLSDAYADVSASLVDANDQLSTSHGLEQKSIEDLEEKLKNLQEIDELLESFEKCFEREHKLAEQYLDVLTNWVGTLENKNSLHEEETRLIENESRLVSDMVNTHGRLPEQSMRWNTVLRSIVSQLKIIWSKIKEFDKETERYVTTNFRLYGTQQQLVQATRELSAEHGILGEKAAETYVALANLSTPRDEIEKYTKVVAQANRYTGVGISQLALYSARLRTVGIGAEGMEKQLRFMSEAMRKFGLSADDVGRILNNTGMSAQTIERMFKGENQYQQYEQLQAIVTGLGKAMGQTSEQASQMFAMFNDPMNMTKFGQFAGQNIEDVDTMYKAFAKGSLKARDELARLDREVEAGLKTQHDMRVEQENLAKVYGMGTVANMEFVASLSTLADQMNMNLEDAEDFKKIMEVLRVKALDPWDESNQSLTAQLNLLSSRIYAMAGMIYALISDALWPFVAVLNTIINYIVWVAQAISGVITWMEEWIPGFEYLMKAVRFAAGMFLGLTLIIIGAGFALATFATLFFGARQIMAGSLNIIRIVGRAIVEIFRAVGESIRVVLTGIGQGLAALGRSVQPVMVPLLALGATVLLVGAGFYLMGLGLYYASEHGWAAAGMLLAMTAILALVIFIMAKTALAVTPALPAMLALATVALIVAAALMLAGIATYFVSMAVESIAKYGIDAAIAMVPLAVGIVALGAAGYFAFTGLMMLAAALWAMAIPIVLIGWGMKMLANSIEVLDVDRIVPAAKALLEASFYILGAGIILVPGAVALAIGASLLFVTSIIVLVAASSLMIGATILGVASAALLLSGIMLFAAAAMIIGPAIMLGIAGIMLGIGGIMMLVGMSAALLAVGVMVLFSAALILAVWGFGVAVALLTPVAIAVLAVGMKIGIGGKALYTGVSQLLAAVRIMKLVSGIIAPAGDALSDSMDHILPAAKKTFWAGTHMIYGAGVMAAGALLLAGAALILAGSAVLLLLTGPALALAAGILFVTGLVLLGSGVMIYHGAMLLMDAGFILDGASRLLMDASALASMAGVAMLWAAGQLSLGSAALILSSTLLLRAAMVLFVAGMWLAPAAFSIYIGMWWLESATNRFVRTISRIDKMGRAMLMLSDSFASLSNAPIGSLKSAVDGALSAMPGVNRLAKELDSSAVMFQSAADKFVKPVMQIVDSLNSLDASLSNIGGSGLLVQDDMNRLGVLLDKYSSLLEGTAERVELAVVSKAMPAMATARNEGLEDMVRSEAITTVQVMDKTDGGAERSDKTHVLLLEQVVLLRTIIERLTGIPNNSDSLADIVTILESHLPNIMSRDEGLSTNMNQWMG